ncbi:TFIIB-type zinc ribbon-containing protein [Natrialbaceae archaeon A-CW1-1]
MNIRGERECTDCGTRWSYFETGSVGCPACGSLRSVGTGERSSHTDRPTDFDLTAVRGAIDDCSNEELADRARAACREYLRNRGFVSGGRLRELDEAYLAAAELNHVADLVARTSQPTEDEELYFLALLRDADAGERPDAVTIPASFREGRGLAVADSIRDYRRDIRLWIEETDRTLSDAARSTLEILIDHETRLRMLDGDVDPGTAETLLEAARHLGNGVRGDEYELELAQERLETVF